MVIPMIQVGNVIVSPDVFIECFCCDLEACGGACCVEGESGAPLLEEEIAQIEDALDETWPLLSASAQSVIDRQGVATIDTDGDLVTSIVGGKDCVFTCQGQCKAVGEHTVKSSVTLCAIEKTCGFKPISCALYPIREKRLSNGLTGINVHRWSVCEGARKKGREEGLRVYEFLREPLVRRFGEAWYDELCTVAKELRQQGLLS